MPVLEILLLKTKPGLSHISPAILRSLQEVRTLLAQKVHNTNSHFFRALEDPSYIYVLGLWPSLAAHKEFLESEVREEVLRPQEEWLEFVWCVHVQLEMEGGGEGWKETPIEAPCVSIAKIKIKEGEKKRHVEVSGKYARVLEEATRPWPVMSGFVLEEGEEKTNVVITGWQGKEAHLAFSAETREKYEEYRSLRECWENVEVRHGVDMEGE